MLAKLRVVVADEPFLSGLTVAMLRNLGVKHIAEAHDSSSTTLALKRAPCGLLIIDDALGPVDPLAIVRELRADPSSPNRSIPILMTFSVAEKNRILAARDAGVTEFLRRPLSANVIGLRLMQTLENPRPFVEAPAYVGPDRRRRAAAAPGPDRRSRAG